jgi:hypothetical protein
VAEPIVAILFRSSGCLAPKDLNSFQSFDFEHN